MKIYMYITLLFSLVFNTTLASEVANSIYLNDLIELIDRESSKYGNPKEIANFEMVLRKLEESNKFKELWNTIYSEIAIEDFILKYEWGDSNYDRYECYAIARLLYSNVVIITNTDLFGEMNIYYKSINDSTIQSIFTTLESNYNLYNRPSVFDTTLGYDGYCGFLNVSYNERANNILLYNVPGVYEDTARNMLIYIDSVFTSFK